MKEHEYQEAITEVLFYFVAAPAIILIGMVLIGAIVDMVLKTDETFAQIFVYIGGIPGIGGYYYKRLKERGTKKEELKLLLGRIIEKYRVKGVGVSGAGKELEAVK